MYFETMLVLWLLGLLVVLFVSDRVTRGLVTRRERQDPAQLQSARTLAFFAVFLLYIVLSIVVVVLVLLS